jgi:hypothetical protein
MTERITVSLICSSTVCIRGQADWQSYLLLWHEILQGTPVSADSPASSARIVTRMSWLGGGGWYPLSERQQTGDAIRGRSIWADRCRLWERAETSQPVVLLGCPVNTCLGFEPESVCITLCPKIHAPTITTKESVAWRLRKRQDLVVT